MPLLDLFAFILNFINAVIVPLIFAIAFLVFIWGIFQAFIVGGDDKKRQEGKKLAFYGIVGFFLMVSVWGLVNILVGTFGFGGQRRPPLPGFGSPSAGINQLIGGGEDDESGKPLGASCPSRNDSECASGECDSDGPGQPWTCVPLRTN